MSLSNIQGTSVTAGLAQAGSAAMNWFSDAAATAGNGAVTGAKIAGKGIADGTRFAATSIAKGASKVAQFASLAFQQLGNALSRASIFTQKTALSGFNFVKAHPQGVGLTVATILLTAVLAT